jgi:tRNA1(Val) A37 N6-methylase TrmN6
MAQMINGEDKKTHMETRQLHGTPYQVVVQKNHAYNLDTILLAHFSSSRIKKAKKIVDIGTGNGVLMLYLSLHTKSKMIGYDIVQSHIEIANQNIVMNHLDTQIQAIHQDINTIDRCMCDAIISNPPYFKYHESSNIPTLQSRSLARFEMTLTVDDIFRVSSKSLKSKQSLLMIHRSERLDELIIKAEQSQFRLKEIQFIHTYHNVKSENMLLHFVKDALAEMTILPPLVLYDAPHLFSEQLKTIYEGVTYATEYIDSKRKT